MDKTSNDDAPAAASDSPREPATENTTTETPASVNGGASPVHSDAESSTSVTITYKRKKRRAAVTEAEDIAILHAIATFAPFRAPRHEMKQRWQKVVDYVVTDTGTNVEVTRNLCQRRYEILLNRFVMKRELQSDWPKNPELRALLEAAVEDRKAREEGVNGPASPTAIQKMLSLSALRAALATASHGKMSLAVKDDAFAPKKEPREEDSKTSEMVTALLDDAKVETAEEDLDEVAATSDVSAKRRSFVESTIVAVLDRVANMEKTWLENAREERQLRLQELEKGKAEKDRPVTSCENGTTKSAVSAVAEPVVHAKPHVVVHAQPQEIEELKKEVMALTESVDASQQTHEQLKDQVATLSTVLEDVRQETYFLKQDVATLQALLRDAASLAGTLKMLRDSHAQHEQTFEAYVFKHDARIEAIRNEIKKRHQLIRHHTTSQQDSTKAREDVVALIQEERTRWQQDHRERLAELDNQNERVAALEASVQKQQEIIQQYEQSGWNQVKEKAQEAPTANAE